MWKDKLGFSHGVLLSLSPGRVIVFNLEKKHEIFIQKSERIRTVLHEDPENIKQHNQFGNTELRIP